MCRSQFYNYIIAHSHARLQKLDKRRRNGIIFATIYYTWAITKHTSNISSESISYFWWLTGSQNTIIYIYRVQGWQKRAFLCFSLAKRVMGRSSNTESKTTFLEVFSPQLNVAMEILIKHNAEVLNIVHGPWLNYTSVNGI